MLDPVQWAWSRCGSERLSPQQRKVLARLPGQRRGAGGWGLASVKGRTNAGGRVEGIWEHPALSLRLFCKSKIIPERKFILEKVGQSANFSLASSL